MENCCIERFKENSLTVQDRMKDSYQYEEEQPAISWILQDETKVILDHICHKAVINFRGRKYTAWFAEDIPLNHGPYLFNGLPGLIMELWDDKDHYHFTAMALDKTPKEIYLRSEKDIFKVTRERFRKVKKAYHDNPSFFSGSSYDAEGHAINDKVKSKPYNPIELK